MVRLRATMVHLPEAQLELLDARAAREGVSRSQLIRDAIGAYMGADEHERVAVAYREGYRRTPPDAADDWGDVGSWHDGLLRERAGEEHEGV